MVMLGPGGGERARSQLNMSEPHDTKAHCVSEWTLEACLPVVPSLHD